MDNGGQREASRLVCVEEFNGCVAVESESQTVQEPIRGFCQRLYFYRLDNSTLRNDGIREGDNPAFLEVIPGIVISEDRVRVKLHNQSRIYCLCGWIGFLWHCVILSSV